MGQPLLRMRLGGKMSCFDPLNSLNWEALASPHFGEFTWNLAGVCLPGVRDVPFSVPMKRCPNVAKSLWKMSIRTCSVEIWYSLVTEFSNNSIWFAPSGCEGCCGAGTEIESRETVIYAVNSPSTSTQALWLRRRKQPDWHIKAWCIREGDWDVGVRKGGDANLDHGGIDGGEGD